jgi:hypothetical protein
MRTKKKLVNWCAQNSKEQVTTVVPISGMSGRAADKYGSRIYELPGKRLLLELAKSWREYSMSYPDVEGPATVFPLKPSKSR